VVRIRRFSVIRTANTVALMYVITIGIVAIPLLLIFLVAAPAPQPSGGPNINLAVAPTLLLLLLVFYGLLGWVFTALACLVYNLTSRFTGGVAMELFHESWSAPAVPPPPAMASPPAAPTGQP
jgi:hypothetical protein